MDGGPEQRRIIQAVVVGYENGGTVSGTQVRIYDAEPPPSEQGVRHPRQGVLVGNKIGQGRSGKQPVAYQFQAKPEKDQPTPDGRDPFGEDFRTERG